MDKYYRRKCSSVRLQERLINDITYVFLGENIAKGDIWANVTDREIDQLKEGKISTESLLLAYDREKGRIEQLDGLLLPRRNILLIGNYSPRDKFEEFLPDLVPLQKASVMSVQPEALAPIFTDNVLEDRGKIPLYTAKFILSMNIRVDPTGHIYDYNEKRGVSPKLTEDEIKRAEEIALRGSFGKQTPKNFLGDFKFALTDLCPSGSGSMESSSYDRETKDRSFVIIPHGSGSQMCGKLRYYADCNSRNSIYLGENIEVPISVEAEVVKLFCYDNKGILYMTNHFIHHCLQQNQEFHFLSDWLYDNLREEHISLLGVENKYRSLYDQGYERYDDPGSKRYSI